MRIKVMIALVALCLLGLAGNASAASVNFGGTINFNPVSGGVGFTFSGLAISSYTGLTADSGIGKAVVFTPSSGSGFVFNSIVGGVGYFSPGGGTLSIGDASSGVLSGNINFMQITSDNAGAFKITVDLSGLSFSNCSTVGCTSSAALATFGSTASGRLTFQFNAGDGPQNLSDLMGISQATNNSVSGTLSVPEPGSLALFGTGLTFGAGFIRRRLARA